MIFMQYVDMAILIRHLVSLGRSKQARSLLVDWQKSKASDIQIGALDFELSQGFGAPDAEVYAETADLLSRFGRLENAEDLLNEGLNLYAKHPDLLSRLGQIRLSEGFTTEAVHLLAEALTLDPQPPVEVAFLFSVAGHSDGQHALVAEVLAAILARNIHNSATQANLQALRARALRNAGKPAEARDLLFRLVDTGAALPSWVKWEIQHALWQAPPASDDFVPQQALQEARLLGASLADLFDGKTQALALPAADSHYTSHALLAIWLRCIVRSVNAAKLTEVQRSSLQAHGVDAAFLDVAAQGQLAVAAQLMAHLPPLADGVRAGTRVRLAAEMARRKAKLMISPFTNDLVETPVNVGPDGYLLRASGRSVIAYHNLKWEQANADTAWFFLRENILLRSCLAVTANQAEDPDFYRIATAFSSILSRPEAFANYASKGNKKIGVMETPGGHIGHYIWNFISGWPMLFDAAGSNLDAILLNRKIQAYGGIDILYPEIISSNNIQVLELAQGQTPDVSAFELAMEHNLVVVRIGDNYITQDLATRIENWAEDAIAPERVQHYKNVLKDCFPLVLINIRLGNRSWVEQAEGYAQVLNALAKDFPKLGVVIDGLNSGTDTLSTHALMSLAEEQDLVAKIIDGLVPEITVCDTIGCPIAESIYLGKRIDAYLAPVGAGMAKYRWVSNKPGVAFANETMMRPVDYDGRLYDQVKFREAPRQATFVPVSAVRNVEESRLGQSMRANFSMDWQPVYETLRDLLKSLVADQSLDAQQRADFV